MKIHLSTLSHLWGPLYSVTTFTVDTTTTTTDTTAPLLLEVTAVTTPTEDDTPNYTFYTTEAGTITYGGSCIVDTINETMC